VKTDIKEQMAAEDPDKVLAELEQKQAIDIVTRAAYAYANGHENAREILRAVTIVRKRKGKR
jgi:hypothetical protein